MENHKKKLITHNGSFHADDLFACATLALVMENENAEYEIIRSRDKKIIETGDYVFDVGGEYNANKNIFDHHQRGGAGTRENGIPYASFGLVWKHFGMKLCHGEIDAFEIIDREIAMPIDANDNGVDIVTYKYFGVRPYMASRVFSIYEPTWKEENVNIDKIFVQEVLKIKELLKREIAVALDDVEGKKIIHDFYHKAENKKLIILDKSFPRYLYQGTLSALPEPVYVIYPSAHGSSFKVEAINQSNDTFESRKPFPESWRGIVSGDPSAKDITGVEGVMFVHNSGFMANLDSKEHAIELAEKALLA